MEEEVVIEVKQSKPIMAEGEDQKRRCNAVQMRPTHFRRLFILIML